MNRNELCLAVAACAMTCTLPFLAQPQARPVKQAEHCPLPSRPLPLMLINENSLGRGIMLPMAGFGLRAAALEALHLSERLVAAQKYRQAINVLQPEWKVNKDEPEVEVTLARAYLGAHNYTQAVPLLGDLMQKFSKYRRRQHRQNQQDNHAHRLELLDFDSFDALEPAKVATLEEDTRRALETYLLTGLDSGRLKPLQPLDRDFKLDRRYRMLVACIAAVRAPECRNDVAATDALYELADENATSLPPSTVSRVFFKANSSDRWLKFGSLAIDAFGAERQFYLHRMKSEIALLPKKDIRVAATYLATVDDYPKDDNGKRVQAYASALEAIPESWQYDRYRANCLYQSGLANFKASDYESAQSRFQAAADLFEKDNRFYEAAVSHFNLGVIKSITENNSAAWKEFETARALNSEVGCRDSALSTCEAVLATESQPSSKFDAFMRTELAPEALRGIYFFKQGDYDKAEQLFANYLKKLSVNADAPNLTGATNGTLGGRPVQNPSQMHPYSQTKILDTFFQRIWCEPVANLKSRYSECSEYELADDKAITVDQDPSYNRVVVQLYSKILLMKDNLLSQTMLKDRFLEYFTSETTKQEEAKSTIADYLTSVKEQVATNWFPPDHRALQQMTVTATLTTSGKLGRIRVGTQNAENLFGESVMESIFWAGKDLPPPPPDWRGGDVQMVFNGDKTEPLPSRLPIGVYFGPPPKWY